MVHLVSGMPETVLMDVDMTRVNPHADTTSMDSLPAPTGVGMCAVPSAVSQESVGDVVGVGRVIKDPKHLEQALVSVDLDETLSPGIFLPFIDLDETVRNSVH